MVSVTHVGAHLEAGVGNDAGVGGRDGGRPPDDLAAPHHLH